jgi:ParB family transcriptional regulator, chromosome partitioning protein
MTIPASSLRLLAESADAPGVTKMTTFRVDPDLVQFEEGFNLRDDNKELEAHIEHLYEAMKQGAFIPPIDVVVETGTIICRDGYCRTTAGQRLKKEVPEFTLEARQLRGNDTDAILHMLGMGGGGLPLTPLQQGRGYLRLIKMGLKVTDIAAKLGISRVTVDKGIILAEAPAKVQKMISTGKISSTAALEAIQNGKEGIEALEKAVAEQTAAPRATKEGKTKKVTKKTLRGTAAEKKPAKRASRKGKPGAPTTDDITVTMSRESAREAVSFFEMILDPDKDPLVHQVRGAIETALL